MQHWLLDSGNSEASTGGDTSESSVNNVKPVGNNGRLHTFRVLVNVKLEPGERVAVTGECKSLGHWLPAHCVQLNRECGKLKQKNYMRRMCNQLLPGTISHLSHTHPTHIICKCRKLLLMSPQCIKILNVRMP